MLVTPNLFITAVSGLIRLGKAGKEVFKERARNGELDYVVQSFDAMESQFGLSSIQQTRHNALQWALGNKASEFRPGGSLDLIFTQESIERGAGYVEIPETADNRDKRRSQIQNLIDLHFSQHVETAFTPEIRAQLERDAIADARIVYLQKQWLTDNAPLTGWKRFAVTMSQVALDVIGSEPQLLGLGDKSEKVLRAMLPGFNRLIDTELLDRGDVTESFGERMMKTFLQGAVSVVSEHPDLVTTEERWKPVITGFLEPVVQAGTGEGGEPAFITQKRLRELLKGPALHGALSAINNNADAFLKGGVKANVALGEISRTILSDLVSDPDNPAGLKLQKTFTVDGVLKVYNTALSTAASRPDLFVKGADDKSDAARQMLAGVASALRDSNPPPFRPEDGLGPEIVSVMFDVARDFADTRIRASYDGDGFQPVWADVFGQLADDLLTGFQKGLQGEEKGSDVFERLFSRDQAVDVVKVMATHIAATPQMLTGKGANEEVRHIAQAVASMVASDDIKLLGAEDWRILIAEMMRAATRNPGVLFGMKEVDKVEEQLGVALFTHVLGKARTSMLETPRAPGKVLFGETLREALVATLQAANGNLRESFQADAAGETGHMRALGKFIDDLNAYAVSKDPNYAMTADEWLHVYKFFIAHVLEHGENAFDELTPELLETALKDSAPQ